MRIEHRDGSAARRDLVFARLQFRLQVCHILLHLLRLLHQLLHIAGAAVPLRKSDFHILLLPGQNSI